MNVKIPIPEPNESYERFAIRTHRSLMAYVPDPEKRNEIVESQWRKHRGFTEEEQIAQRRFDDQKYRNEPNVCHFAEHDAIDGQGNPRHYDLGELARIVRSLNHRIADFDGFTPITDGHTLDDPEPGQEPEVLGYAGPYRLGMIGRKKPRWAIFGDEHHIRECAPILDRKKRRSVELWTFAHDPNRTHFDPVAAIGAETPRLALPIKFTRHNRDGALVERYTFSAPAAGASASPGGSNTYLKKFEREDTPMLSNEDVSQIMQALLETPHFKWIDRQMQSEQSAGDQEQPEQYMGGKECPEDEYMGKEQAQYMEKENDDGAEVPDDPIADLNDLIASGAEEDEEEVEVNVDKSMRKKHSRAAGATGAEDIAVKYSRLQASHNRLVQQQGRMANQLLAMHKRNADAERTTALMELGHKYPDFVDLEAEFDRTLYSRKASLTDKQFDEHVAHIERYARKAQQMTAVNGRDIPQGQLDRGRPSDAETEKYQARLSSEAVRIHTQAVNAGKNVTYDECLAKAEEALSKSA